MECEVLTALQSDESSLDQVIPEKMTNENLKKIAFWVAKWKSGDVLREEGDAVEAFALWWVEQVSKLQGTRIAENFNHAQAELLVLAMAELEYLVQQELISRQLNYKTYVSELEHFFNLERVKRYKPDFLRQYLVYCGFGIIPADLVGPMISIAEFLKSVRK